MGTGPAETRFRILLSYWKIPPAASSNPKSTVKLIRFSDYVCGCRRIKHMEMLGQIEIHNEVKDAAENHGILLFLPMTQMKNGTQHDNQHRSCQPE